MDFDLPHALKRLASTRSVFHSEPDFQHALAWSIHEVHPDAGIRLEIPFASPTGELDLLVVLGRDRIGIELKYVRAAHSCTVDGECFKLPKSPLPPSRYGFWSDLSRVEEWVTTGQLTRGFAIALSNCQDCWGSPTRLTTQEAIRFHDGLAVNGALALDARPRSTREFPPVTLRGSYRCEWRDFSVAGDGHASTFRYLLLEAKSAPAHR